MHLQKIVALAAGAALPLAASGAVFWESGQYTTSSAQFSAWQAASGVGLFGLETFDSYTAGPAVEIAPGTSLITPSGLEIFFDESPDASSASRAVIDVVNSSWTGTPPFEGSASFEGFSLVPGGVGTGTNTIQFIFDTPVIGFAGDWESPASGADLVVLIDGVQVVAFADFLTSGADGFLGYVHDSAFTTIEFTAVDTSFAGEVWDVDNVYWAVVPAPGSIATLGVACLFGLKRRR